MGQANDKNGNGKNENEITILGIDDAVLKTPDVAGIDWTVASEDGWDSANMAMFIGDMETMQRIVRGLYENAMRLKVKRLVLTE